jgi:hypothetical protein
MKQHILLKQLRRKCSKAHKNAWTRKVLQDAFTVTLETFNEI